MDDIQHEIQTSMETSLNHARRLRVRYSLKNAEFEAEGNPEDVNRHAIMFLSIATGQKTSRNHIEVAPPYQLALFEESDVPLLADSDTSEDADQNGEGSRGEDDLVAFYLKKTMDPNSETCDATQHEQLLIITHFFEEFKHRDHVKLADYRTAYVILSEVPVSVPRNITARLKELLKNGMLRSIAQGYALTLRGKQIVNKKGRGS